MYIIEKLFKICEKLLKKEKNIYIPKYEDKGKPKDVITCKHNFMPIDSTGEILACSKCGYLITKKRLIRTSFKK